MHPQFLELLHCPITGGELTLRVDCKNDLGAVIAGTLRGPDGHGYPIVRGVPRFVAPERYLPTEANSWRRGSIHQRGPSLEPGDAQVWKRITGANPSQVRGRMILDFGCGVGRFTRVIRSQGGLAVGIDGTDAVDSARRNFADDVNVLLVQGDLFHPPFRPGIFDGGFSIGALHHTADPATAVSALTELIRPNGWVSCCVLPRGDLVESSIIRKLRQWHFALRQRFGYRVATGYAYLAAYAVASVARRIRHRGLDRQIDSMKRNWVSTLYGQSVRWNVLDALDAIQPEIVSTHTTEEVSQWLHRETVKMCA